MGISEKSCEREREDKFSDEHLEEKLHEKEAKQNNEQQIQSLNNK